MTAVWFLLFCSFSLALLAILTVIGAGKAQQIIEGEVVEFRSNKTRGWFVDIRS